MEIAGGPFGDLALGEGVRKGDHPLWYPPVAGVDKGLMVHNSLTNTLEPFKPATGNRVLWYTCGPTVYDSCHMGHARAYLTFDILRRIMQDYFQYEVLYHVNITDIDDKIILRARRNKLVANYMEGRTKEDFGAVLHDIEEALAKKTVKFVKKRKALDTPLAEGTAKRLIDEHEVAGKEFNLKERQLENIKARIALIQMGQAAAEGQGPAAMLVEVCAKASKLLGLETDGSSAALAAALEAKASSEEAEGNQELTGNVAFLFSLLDSVQAAGESGFVAALVQAGGSELGEDLDDKLGASITDKEVFDAHARRFEREYMEDMAALGVQEPDVLTRVTEYVQDIQAYIQKIVDKDLAYECNGSVYLSIDEFKKQGHEYRKLKPFEGETSEAAMAESEGALGTSTGDKRHPNDFALWKASKKGEPSWDSAWGAGRPGWHIECSVVASDILGPNLDVHAGGVDLKFPHHDNELAQSESYYGHHQWVNYFFHAGHLHIQGLKMSKSLKNFITIREALTKHTARQLRLMFLTQAWDKDMEYSTRTANEAKRKEMMFKNFFGAVKAVLRKDWLAEGVGFRNKDADMKLIRAIQTCHADVHASLCKNFDTKSAILALSTLVTVVNKYLDQDGIKPATLLLQKAAVYVTQILRVLGVVEGNENVGFPAEGGAGDRESTLAPVLDAFVQFRDAIRSAASERKEHKDILAECDAVRDDIMIQLGVQFEDLKDGPTWKLDDPATLIRNLAEKKAADAAKAAQKKRNKLTKLQKALKKVKEALSAPTELFKTPEYTEWDDAGLPTKLASGEELKKSTAKKLAKQMAKYMKDHESLTADAAKAELSVQDYVAGLVAEVAALAAELEQ